MILTISGILISSIRNGFFTNLVRSSLLADSILEASVTASFEIIDYIYRNYSEALTPKSVADHFDISTKQLNRILLYQVERNYEDFLNFVRVNRASELLLSTDWGITDIAVAVGYNSAKTLTRNFLKLRLMPPGVFRQTVELQEDDLK